MRHEGEGEAEGALDRGRGVRCNCAGMSAACQMFSNAHILISSDSRSHHFGFVGRIR